MVVKINLMHFLHIKTKEGLLFNGDFTNVIAINCDLYWEMAFFPVI